MKFGQKTAVMTCIVIKPETQAESNLQLDGL